MSKCSTFNLVIGALIEAEASSDCFLVGPQSSSSSLNGKSKKTIILKYDVNVLVSLICRLQDVAGYGVAMAAGKVLANAFSDRSFTSPLVELLLKNGRNGKRDFCNHAHKSYLLFQSS